MPAKKHNYKFTGRSALIKTATCQLQFLVCLLLVANCFISTAIADTSSADRQLSQLLIGAWAISGNVSENMNGKGVIEFLPTGDAMYQVELYLNSYLIDRIENNVGWSVRERHIRVRARNSQKPDTYGLLTRAEQEPIKVLSINHQKLICQTKNYGVLVFERVSTEIDALKTESRTTP